MSSEEPGAGDGSVRPADRDEEAVIAEVLRALRSIEYGSVLIKLHQGQVVAMETSTKVRLRGN